jgi:predicted GIY-YIG superfamily endonuclease
VRGALEETEAELETVVQAPVAGGVDPTAWLPDEIVWLILVRVLVGGICGRVCRRWHAVCAGATAKKQAWQWRWAGYTHGKATPRTLAGGPIPLALRFAGAPKGMSLAVGLNGTLYYSDDRVQKIDVWSTVTNTHLQTLGGHTERVYALTVGRDGAVYTGSGDKTVRVWSAEDGSHLDTLEGHTRGVMTLAVGADGTLYSGSSDDTIRVWANRQGGSRHLRTLEVASVAFLALGKDAKVYTGCWDRFIRVWSTVDGSDLGALEGHTAEVYVVVVAADGTVYTGSKDHTLRTWSGLDGAPIRTVQIGAAVLCIAIGAGNTVLIGDGKGRVSVWDGGAAPARTLFTFTSYVEEVAIGQDGRLFVRCSPNLPLYAL